MVVFRRRLIFWLIKAYIKKSGKTLIISFFLGLFIFFAVALGSKYFVKILPIYKKNTIGIVGAYTQENLPPLVVEKLSRGLTSIAKDGTVKPDIASGWDITNNGKTYTFHLKQNIHFSDKAEVTSDLISYNFSDVAVEKPDKYTIVFKLKDAYAPFLTTASRPLMRKGFIGVGDYQIEDIKLNGNYVQSLTLTSAKNRLDRMKFQFYPTDQALKIAFLLGEVSETSGLTDKNFKDISFDNFSNTKVTQESNYSRLVTLFFDTTDGALSDKKLRLALSYGIPDSFSGGQRAYLPYSPESIFSNKDLVDKKQDYIHAKLLLSASNTASDSAELPKLTIKTLRKYRPTANNIALAWKEMGINTTIQDVDIVPDNFQIFLGDFYLPRDPDQYTLWHSAQKNNITKYKNVRIDKLLEDGRKTVDLEERKNLYADFQKYLLDDVPAIFLYFPTEYQIKRK